MSLSIFIWYTAERISDLRRGANYDKDHGIQPDMTSYDYDAPISEAGWVTPKYDSIRNVIGKYVDYVIPEVPAPNPVIEIPSIRLTESLMCWPSPNGRNRWNRRFH